MNKKFAISAIMIAFVGGMFFVSIMLLGLFSQDAFAQTPAIGILITPSEQYVFPGDIFYYDVTLSNNGDGTAYNIAFSFDLSGDHTKFLVSDFDCSISDAEPFVGDLICSTPDTIAPGNSINFKIPINVHDDAAFGHTFSGGIYFSAEAFDEMPAGTSTLISGPSTPQPFESFVSVGIGEGTLFPPTSGQPFNLFIGAYNQGPADAESVDLYYDISGPGFISESDLPSDCVMGESIQDIVCSVEILSPDSSFERSITILVDPGLGEGQSFSNNVNVFVGSGNDPFSDDDSTSWDNLEILPAPPHQFDLSVDAGVASTEVFPGNTFWYSILVTNNGPDDARYVSLDTRISGPGIIDASSIPTGCTINLLDESGLLCNIGDALPSGESQETSFAVLVDQGAQKDSSFSISAQVLYDDFEDVNPENDAIDLADALFVSVLDSEPLQADLVMGYSLEESLDSTLEPGQKFFQTITVSNHGPNDAKLANVINTVSGPGHISEEDMPQECFVTTSIANQIICSLGTIENQKSNQVTLYWIIDSDAQDGQIFANEFSATSSYEDPNDNQNNSFNLKIISVVDASVVPEPVVPEPVVPEPVVPEPVVPEPVVPEPVVPEPVVPTIEAIQEPTPAKLSISVESLTELKRPISLGLYDVAIQSTGKIITYDTAIQISDSEGNYITQFGPMGDLGIIAIDSSDNIFVAINHPARIIKYNPEGNFGTGFISALASSVPIGDIQDIAFDSSDNMYILDSERIQKFDNSGNFIAEFGQNGQYLTDTGIGARELSVDSSDNLYVLAGSILSSPHIEKLSSNGEFLLKFNLLDDSAFVTREPVKSTIKTPEGDVDIVGENITSETWELKFEKSNIAIDPSDDIYVLAKRNLIEELVINDITYFADILLYKYDSSGKLLGEFKINPDRGLFVFGYPFFFHPNGDLYMSGQYGKKIEVFTPHIIENEVEQRWYQTNYFPEPKNYYSIDFSETKLGLFHIPILDDNTGAKHFDVEPGFYSIKEQLPVDLEVLKSECDDGSSLDAIDISQGEHVTCKLTIDTPTLDTDGDGIPDYKDKCVYEKEDGKSGFIGLSDRCDINDGCPCTEEHDTGCLIATASYGSPMANEVQMLREIRDNQLLQTDSGSAFMSGFNAVYYSFAPTIAHWEDENPAFKEIVKIAITPLISSLSILNYVDIDTEAEVLSYGISLIVLNIGMYMGIPVVIIVGIRRV